MKNTTCTFDVHSDKRKPVPRSYVAALEARIKTLEDVIRATAGATLPEDAPLEDIDVDVEDAELGISGPGPRTKECSGACTGNCCARQKLPHVDGGLPEDSGASAEAILDISRLRLCVSQTEDMDTLNVEHPTAASSSSKFCYYGPTSGRFLSCAGTPEPALTGLFGHCGVRESINERKTTNIFDDPLERELLERFWEWQDNHFAVVNQEIFLESYNNGERDSEWVSPMLIDMMLAVGVLYGHKGKGRRAFYASRAEALVMHELGRPTMATMQAVLLMAVFQMGAGRVSVAWSLNGLAVAMSNKMGLHIDSTDLVARGIMSQRMKDMRDATFWCMFTNDRIFAAIMGVHPLHSRRSISTKRYAGGIRPSVLPSNVSLAGGEPARVVNQHTLSGFEATYVRMRDLCDIVETMLTDIYAFDAPVRSAMEDYDLVVKNNLILQAFVEDLPSSLNVENMIRATTSITNLRPLGVHIFINSFIILINRPFIGVRHQSLPCSDQSARATSAANQAVERRCRSLAFGHCRTAALRVIALVKHLIPSPCLTTAYDIFCACTVLLLCPQDRDAMKAVRTGLEYLDQLKRSHHWVEPADEHRRRILGLAQKWGVQLFPDDSPASDSSRSYSNTPPVYCPPNTQNVAGLPTTTDEWSNVNPSQWGTLPVPDIESNPFMGPDAALFAAYSSAELGSMYGNLGVPMDITPEVDTWWFMGTQPGFEFGRLGDKSDPSGGFGGLM